jgi:hypothetical protein
MWIIVGLLLIALVCSACGPEVIEQTEAQRSAQSKAMSGEVYQPRNDVERRNYNWRQEISDDPTTIVWCTFAWPIPDSPLVTIPVAGKLTSGSKRPYPVEQVIWNTSSGSYFPEVPGPDGMFGSSGDYRFGFGPAGRAEYHDLYGLPVYCTNMPRVWHREHTTIMFDQDETLLTASQAAKTALNANDPDEATRILQEAISQVQGGQ